MSQQKHQEIANILMRRIFARDLKPGEKLPTEKELSAAMKVDRNALRVALKIVESMGVLDIRQGDGMYVRDYVENAGIDFLRLLIIQGGDKGSDGFMDGYLADEIMEVWTLIFPGLMAAAAMRFSTRHIKELMALLEEEERNLDDREALIQLDVRSQDIIAEALDNTVVLMLFNSFRPLREMMFRVFLSNVSREDLENHVRVKRELLQAAVSGSQEEAMVKMDQFNQHLSRFRGLIRKSWG